MKRFHFLLLFLVCFLLPFQTRWILFRPQVGTTLSEFGVLSVYASMLVVWIACLFFLPFRMRVGAMASMFLVLLYVFLFPASSTALGLLTIVSAATVFCIFRVGFQHAPMHTTLFLCLGLLPSVFLGFFQVILGYSPESTLLGVASRDAARLGDAVLVLFDARVLRAYGFFSHPNVFGAVLALVFGVVAGLYGRSVLCGNVKTLRPYAWSIVPPFLLVFLFVSRTAALAVVLAAACVFLRDARFVRVRMLLWFIPCAVWGIQFLFPELLAFVRGGGAFEMRSIVERTEQLTQWWSVFFAHPWFGVGYGQYGGALAQVLGGLSPAWAYQPVHHVVLLALAEVGVVGVFCVAVCCMDVAFLCGNVKNATPLRFVYDDATPLLVTLWTLLWFDHVLWTSWVGIAYAALALALLTVDCQLCKNSFE